MIDLHCHSLFSDGTLTPLQLIERALVAKIKFLALTDHDTTAGLNELHNKALGHDLKIINGIELSAQFKKHDIHIIGLRIDPQNEQLCDFIAKQSERRKQRAIQIGVCLENLGVSDAYAKACEIAGHERIARPHFAKVLINAGIVCDMKTAFKRFLARGKPAYVPTIWPSVEDVVGTILSAGGDAIIAHPLKLALTRLKLFALINAFQAAGGIGIEVVSGEMLGQEIRQVADICKRFNLLASSGSDFHSDASRVGLGMQRELPDDCIPIWQEW